MEYLTYRTIKAKLKKRGILFKKPSIEDASNDFYSLARQLDDHKLYSGYCHLAIANCQAGNKISAQTGAFLNAARSFAKANHDIVSREDHIKLVIWIYTEALLICDRTFIRPIRLEMGRFYELHGLYQQAAECYKQSMCISGCVNNLIFAKCYRSALDELKNCPSHLLSTKEHTSMFLLELLLNEDIEELNRNSLQILSDDSRVSTNRGLLPTDDNLYDLAGLLESLLILQKEKEHQKNEQIKQSIIERLSAFLDPAQIRLLQQITSNIETR